MQSTGLSKGERGKGLTIVHPRTVFQTAPPQKKKNKKNAPSGNFFRLGAVCLIFGRGCAGSAAGVRCVPYFFAGTGTPIISPIACATGARPTTQPVTGASPAATPAAKPSQPG